RQHHVLIYCGAVAEEGKLSQKFEKRRNRGRNLERNRAPGRPEEDGGGGGGGEGDSRWMLYPLLPAATSGDLPTSRIVPSRPRCGHGSSDAHGSFQDTWSWHSRATNEDGSVQWQEIDEQQAPSTTPFVYCSRRCFYCWFCRDGDAHI
ncbi:unnamed protein product, partial [Urochloa humidicola]